MEAHSSETDRNKLDRIEEDWLAAWMQGFANPLIPLRLRNEYELQLMRIAHAKPHVIASIFTGAISMMSRALPAEDPWRNLKRVSDTEVILPDGYEFDSYSATDLCPSSTANIRLDPYLAPLAIELDDASKVLLAAAPAGWDQTLSTAERIFPLANPSMDDAEAILESLVSALRWITFRYLAYTDPDSRFVIRCLALSMQYCDAPMNQDTKIIETLDAVDEESKIRDGNYTLIVQSEY